MACLISCCAAVVIARAAFYHQRRLSQLRLKELRPSPRTRSNFVTLPKRKETFSQQQSNRNINSCLGDVIVSAVSYIRSFLPPENDPGKLSFRARLSLIQRRTERRAQL